MRISRCVVVSAVTLAAGATPAPVLGHDDDRVYVLVSKIGPGYGRVVSEPAGIDCGRGCLATFPGNWEANYAPVTLYAYAEPGSSFVGWEGACTGRDPCTLALDDSKVVSARFDGPPRPRHDVSVRVVGPGAVTSIVPGISCGAVCSAAFDEGSVVSLVALPEPKARFAGWSGACAGVAACSLTVNGSKSVKAVFEAIRDMTPPAVRALATSARRGDVARLRYRVADDSGRSSGSAVVYRGSRRLAQVGTPLADHDAEALYNVIPWRVPTSLRPGKLRFCVSAADEAGNRSAASCAPLNVR
jgi:hypothetical protein